MDITIIILFNVGAYAGNAGCNIIYFYVYIHTQFYKIKVTLVKIQCFCRSHIQKHYSKLIQMLLLLKLLVLSICTVIKNYP